MAVLLSGYSASNLAGAACRVDWGGSGATLVEYRQWYGACGTACGREERAMGRLEGKVALISGGGPGPGGAREPALRPGGGPRGGGGNPVAAGGAGGEEQRGPGAE